MILPAAAPRFDALIVGGGFYGTAIAGYLARRRGLRRIIVLEQEPHLLARASSRNQARVHGGYHYPRSFTTAYRSRINAPRFARDWPGAMGRSLVSLYAIARGNSKVTASQFVRFCREIGAPARPASKEQKALFERRLVEDVFVVEEPIFDADALAALAGAELADAGIEVRRDARVRDVSPTGSGVSVFVAPTTGPEYRLEARYLFNCTYSGLRHLAGGALRTNIALKHEIAELAIVRQPSFLDGMGITLLDGPFFSTLPHPATGLHTLSHVRYTPHLAWLDEPGTNPYARLDAYPRISRVERMMRDAARYLPCIREAEPVGSLFEVKTVLGTNEADDGRPIVFDASSAIPGCFSILGSKIDNIYDIFERLDAERLDGSRDAKLSGAAHA